MKKNLHIIDTILPAFVFVGMSLLLLVLSMQSNAIQQQISALINFIFTLNNITSVILPFLLFVFFFLTIKISLSIFNLSIENRVLYEVIGYSFIPMLFYDFLFAINFVIFTNHISVTTQEEFFKIKYMFGLTILDFQRISLIVWLITLIVMIILLKKKTGFSYIISSISVLLPIVLVFLFKLILS